MWGRGPVAAGCWMHRSARRVSAFRRKCAGIIARRDVAMFRAQEGAEDRLGWGGGDRRQNA